MNGTGNNERLLEKKPQISKELVDWLEAIFPLISPDLQDSERFIFYRCGQRSVVDCLRSLHQQQSETLISDG